jgi:hypothetical protein
VYNGGGERWQGRNEREEGYIYKEMHRSQPTLTSLPTEVPGQSGMIRELEILRARATKSIQKGNDSTRRRTRGHAVAGSCPPNPVLEASGSKKATDIEDGCP